MSLYLSYPSKSKDIRKLVKKKTQKTNRNLICFSLQDSSFQGKFSWYKALKCFFYFFGLHYL